MRFSFDFSKLSFLEILGVLGNPEKIGIFLGFSWDFLGIFLGCPKKLGIFWGFLGIFWDPRKSGIFWDFAHLLEYSDTFYVFPHRLWILLFRVLVTHLQCI